jgi:chromosomal replication initiation ATPase DnaA
MNKSIFSIIFLLLFTALIPAAKSETFSNRNTVTELVQHLLGAKSESTSSRQKKKKLKKIVRKTARVYRSVKTDSESRKKSRKIQRKARRIINIF